VYTGFSSQKGLGRQLGYTRGSTSSELQMGALVAVARVKNATFLIT
jgi:hypothetical protein